MADGSGFRVPSFDFRVDWKIALVIGGLTELNGGARMVIPKGIYPPLPGAEKIQYVQMEVLEAKAFEEKKREFGKIFLR